MCVSCVFNSVESCNHLSIFGILINEEYAELGSIDGSTPSVSVDQYIIKFKIDPLHFNNPFQSKITSTNKLDFFIINQCTRI